jgi:succinate-acetate transporter protein
MESSVQDRTAPGVRTADAPDPTRDETAAAQTARVVETKPVTADPGPLGLAAFALTTFVLSIFNSGLMSEKGLPVVLGLALAYGGFAQLLAGMWEFRTGNTFGAVAFTSYGAFWISFWAFEQFYAKDITDKVALGNSVGLFLIAWGIFTAYMFIASLRTTAAISLVFLLLATTFIVLGIGNAEADEGITHAGGYIGIATAIAAWYASFAAVTNSTFGRTVLPVKELKK